MSEAKERLDRLRAKRGGHRGVCTKLVKEAEELAISPENGDISRCEIIKSLLQEKLKILNDIDEEILGLCDIKEIESEIEESTEIVARILNAIKNIEGSMFLIAFKIGKCNSQPTASSGEVNTSNTSVISENS